MCPLRVLLLGASFIIAAISLYTCQEGPGLQARQEHCPSSNKRKVKRSQKSGWLGQLLMQHRFLCSLAAPISVGR